MPRRASSRALSHEQGGGGGHDHDSDSRFGRDGYIQLLRAVFHYYTNNCVNEMYFRYICYYRSPTTTQAIGHVCFFYFLSFHPIYIIRFFSLSFLVETQAQGHKVGSLSSQLRLYPVFCFAEIFHGCFFPRRLSLNCACPHYSYFWFFQHFRSNLVFVC